ncbi:hypothetical protein RHMOL_Rhmol09G0260800 [Rhododendron molle]|uniref:Uncharacterized protein n=1 Tax=Rhododendron molle TaxID=49168 RepID=A0ACC0MHD5_RHOML|nr:hypothetical protein RHMOL_Rhmol09G0260800 [Rhododendron molle]
MAVVVKRNVNVSSGAAKMNMDTNSYLKGKQIGRKGIHSPFGKKEHIHYSTDASSSLYSSDNETQSPALESIMEQGHMHWQLEKWEEEEGCITYEELESVPNNSDEEVIGIITMEDVMEELLQEEILDETDEYVDVHNRLDLCLASRHVINLDIQVQQVHNSTMAANDVPCCETMFWVYLMISAGLVLFAGIMSGLTLGLMSLSLVDLEVLTKAGQPKDRKNAAKILPIVKNQHLLLCTLLICNAMAMEIIPQAVCSRYGLSVGAKLSGVVRVLVIIFFPISYPISKLLDFLLGKGHSALLRRAELKTLVDLHGNEAGKGGELTHDETTIISGALDLTQKMAKDAMTPMSKIFSLDLNSKLNEETMSLLMSKGHSRVPVYSGSPTNIIGLILVKNLIKCHPEDETPIRNLTIRRIPRVRDSLPLYEILNQFQKGHSHMAVVVKSKHDITGSAENATAENGMFQINIKASSEKGMQQYASSVTSSETETQSPALHNVFERRDERGDDTLRNEALESLPDQEEEVIGIITMEDVLEELLQEEILDETDEYVDVHNKIKINMAPSIRSLSSRSPGAPSHMTWRTPGASPLSSSHPTPASYHQTAILRSPIAPYMPSPLIRPTLCPSPGQSVSTSPAAGFSGLVRSSPSSHRVSRKPYEKLKQPK